MADPTKAQPCLLQAILPDGGPVYWSAVIALVDTVERLFAIDDAGAPAADLPAPLQLAIDAFWDDPQIAPVLSAAPGAPPFPINVVPGMLPLGGYAEGIAADVDEFRDLFGMAPLDDGGDDLGPEEVARAAMRAWLGSLGLSVPFVGLNAENPRAGRRLGLPRVSIFFGSVEWTPTRPTQAREAHTINQYATGELAPDELGVPDDERGALAYDADGRAIIYCGFREASFSLRFEFRRRAEARAIRREFPLALAYIADRGDDRGLQGGQQAGVVRLPIAFGAVRVHGEEVSLYFEGTDTLAGPEDTGTRNRWILQYTGMAAYPWLEAGVTRTLNDLNVRISLDGGAPILLDDLDLPSIGA